MVTLGAHIEQRVCERFFEVSRFMKITRVRERKREK